MMLSFESDTSAQTECEEIGPRIAATDYANCFHLYQRRAGWNGGKRRTQCLLCGKRMTIGSTRPPPLSFSAKVRIGKLILAGSGYRKIGSRLGITDRQARTAIGKIKRIIQESTP